MTNSVRDFGAFPGPAGVHADYDILSTYTLLAHSGFLAIHEGNEMRAKETGDDGRGGTASGCGAAVFAVDRETPSCFA